MKQRYVIAAGEAGQSQIKITRLRKDLAPLIDLPAAPVPSCGAERGTKGESHVPQDAIESAKKLLPAWFTERMMTDEWPFGLLLTTGHILCISRIESVHQAADETIWLDVDMIEDMPSKTVVKQMPKMEWLLSPTSRKRASVQACHIIAAMELADT